MDTDRLALLTVSRDTLALTIDTADAKALPALVRELRAVLRELAELGAGQEASTVDDLRDRRARRQAEAG